MRDLYQALINQECKPRGINPFLIYAIVRAESNWNPWATRYEPLSSYKVGNPKIALQLGISQITEQISQKISFGLGQIMGSTSRSLGYKDHLTKLCDPKTNIFWMCELIEKISEKYSKIEDKIAAYNAGSVRHNADGFYSNQIYVDKILTYLEEYKNGQGDD